MYSSASFSMLESVTGLWCQKSALGLLFLLVPTGMHSDFQVPLSVDPASGDTPPEKQKKEINPLLPTLGHHKASHKFDLNN